jgi:hypothetical protein
MLLILFLEVFSDRVYNGQNNHEYDDHDDRKNYAAGLHYRKCFRSIEIDQGKHHQRLVLLQEETQRETPEQFFVQPVQRSCKNTINIKMIIITLVAMRREST